ncbi:hypothetical protein JX265_005191 [Neoarthrinium moseri]|uniref:Uncharacterized protein n=1 Tax=Neoarthrinium moseri TaxID=1658444 RepID=A0A9P9WPN1_9PEZI|nr:hypothetical protein JX265_005191 [Neoarthrinium moseri]
MSYFVSDKRLKAQIESASRYERAQCKPSFDSAQAFKWETGDIALLKSAHHFDDTDYHCLVNSAYIPKTALGNPVIILSRKSDDATHAVVISILGIYIQTPFVVPITALGKFNKGNRRLRMTEESRVDLWTHMKHKTAGLNKILNDRRLQQTLSTSRPTQKRKATSTAISYKLDPVKRRKVQPESQTSSSIAFKQTTGNKAVNTNNSRSAVVARTPARPAQAASGRPRRSNFPPTQRNVDITHRSENIPKYGLPSFT